MIRWWIGFTEKPLDESAQQGISVLANGKMAQRPFQFGRSQGTEGQLGQEYLVGEVEANWIDAGADIEDDLIQSNRDQLQIEEDRLAGFLSWGRDRLRWALKERNRLRSLKRIEEFEEENDLAELFSGNTKHERERLMKVAKTVARLPELPTSGVADVMREVINAQADVVVREMIEKISEEDDHVQERMWELVREFGLIDARRTQTIIEGRIGATDRLATQVADGTREVPDLHNTVRENAWLLDPRWHLYDDEVDVSDWNPDYAPELDETGERIDFLFVLKPKAPAPIDEVIVVEIKRARKASGAIHNVSEGEVNKFHSYVLTAIDHYSKSTNPPRVRGLMIAQGYTEKANRMRRSVEKTDYAEFKTWDLVIDETRRMHLGWLEVSKKRGSRGA
ncbi:MAG: hypothetical protein FJ091_09720 [Deltaproteobacteria bacterium]|nr:hypothetical protein [Deltaproteobacteria bacterium]